MKPLTQGIGIGALLSLVIFLFYGTNKTSTFPPLILDAPAHYAPSTVSKVETSQDLEKLTQAQNSRDQDIIYRAVMRSRNEAAFKLHNTELMK